MDATYTEPTLTTERLVLEPLTAWHGESLFPFLKEPLLYTFIPREPPLASSHVVKRFDAIQGRKSPDGKDWWLNWAVRVATNGYCGVVEATVPEAGPALVAYTVFLNHQRQGYGREAMAALIDHLAVQGITEAAAFIDTRNAPSIRLIEALGFHRVATHRAREKLRGRFVDDHEYRKNL